MLEHVKPYISTNSKLKIELSPVDAVVVSGDEMENALQWVGARACRRSRHI